jgi:hypothetical protein
MFMVTPVKKIRPELLPARSHTARGVHPTAAICIALALQIVSAVIAPRGERFTDY